MGNPHNPLPPLDPPRVFLKTIPISQSIYPIIGNSMLIMLFLNITDSRVRIILL